MTRTVTTTSMLLLTAALSTGCTSSSGGVIPAAAEDLSGTGMADSATGLVPDIKSVGFDFVYNLSSFEVRPVLLLKGGIACDCLDVEIDRITLDEVREVRPKDVGEWREGPPGKVEVKYTGDWRKLFTRRGVPLGDGWRTSGSYHRVDSAGTPGVDYVGVASQVQFQNDGRFRWSKVGSKNSTNEVEGSYDVAGWMLTLSFDDGETLRVTALGDGTDGSALYLGGHGYSSK